MSEGEGKKYMIKREHRLERASRDIGRNIQGEHEIEGARPHR